MADVLPTAANVFRVVAEEYCRLIYRAEEMERERWLEAVHHALARVYAAAFELPDVGPQSDDDMDARVDSGDIRAMYKRLSRLLGDDEPYRMVFKVQTSEPPITSSLADDLADVYADLSEGLNLLALGADPADVIWAWRMSFVLHWGKHAAEALIAIHHLRFVS